MSVVMMPLRRSVVPSPVVAFPSGARLPGPSARRKGSLEQGRALEILGHAIEYLVDSRLFALDQAAVRSDDEAVQIMMRLSRAVFAECPEVISMRRKLRLWLTEQLAAASELNPMQ